MGFNYICKSDEASSLVKKKPFKVQNEKNLTDLERISAHYFMGMYYITLRNANNSNEINRKTADENKIVIEILKNYPIELSSYFLKNAYGMACDYITDKKEKLQYTLEYKEFEEKLIEIRKKRGFQFIKYRGLINIYALLAKNVEELGADSAAVYLARFVELNDQYPNDNTYPYVYNHNNTCFWHYYNRKEYEKALEYIDPLLDYFGELSDRFDLKMLYSTTGRKVECLDSLKRYEEAYFVQKEYIALMDTVQQFNFNEQMQDAEVNKQLEELLVQKKQLEVDLHRNRIQLYFAIAFFVIVILIAVFVYFRLDKVNKLYIALQNTNNQLHIANQKALEGEKAKNTFIRNICHEVRTPLNSINGFSELILNPDIPEEDKAEFSRIIFGSCSNITSMMDDLLTISQLDNGSQALSLEPLHIHEICHEQLDSLIKLQGKSTIHYIFEGDSNQDTALTNKYYFTMMISHLLTNANKFTDSGEIKISYKADTEKQKMEIRVMDTGCGISADKREWIFDRFTKSDDFSQGSGLGLYLCRLITNNMQAQDRKSVV